MRFPLALHAVLFFKRRDPLALVGGAVLCVGIALGTIVLPHRTSILADAVTRLDALRQENARAPEQRDPTVAEDRLLLFRRALGARHETEQHVETLLAIARDKQLTVRKAEYRNAYNKTGQYHTYQVTIPFQSGYAPVRAFCDEVLRALPFVAIDAVLFSRSAVDVIDVDAKVVLTFFLADADLSAAAAPPARSSTTAIRREAVIR